MFGWIVSDSRRGAVQSAYRVVVATSAFAQRADVWDSGKIRSADSVNIRCGCALEESKSAYWWSVRTWDGDDRPSEWSTPQKFYIGKADPGAAFYPDEWVDSPVGSVRVNRHPLGVHRIAPKEIINQGDGHCFIDFGKAAFGTVELSLSSSDSRQLSIVLGEKRAAGNAVDSKPGGSIVAHHCTLQLKPGKHKYVLELPTYERGIRMPKHIGEVTPFRYCEIANSPCEITTNDIRQCAVWYRFDDQSASFSCSDVALNNIWELCKYSIKATSALGIYIDGQRERLPYEADAFINQLGHYCVDREYAMARYTHEHLIKRPTWPTEWILFSVLMAWEDYVYTGDRQSLLRCYDDLAAKTLLALAREDGLISTRTGLLTKDVLQSVHFSGGNLRDIVDWPHPTEIDGYDFRDINTVVNAFHYRALALMERIAGAIGRDSDARRFRRSAQRVYASINQKLYDKFRGVYVDGEGSEHASLHANMFALAFGLVDEARRSSVISFIKGRGMACSVYGAQFLLEALYRADEDIAALELMTAPGDRSWPHMLYNIGTTITLEAWDAKYKPNLDWNHAWGAAPANIIPRLLVGVEPIAPGYASARIKPRIGSLNNVDAVVPTIRGPIEVSIKRDEGEYRLRCAIPANMSAEIHFPASDLSQVTESGLPVQQARCVEYIGTHQNCCVFRVQSGRYDFSAKRPRL